MRYLLPLSLVALMLGGCDKPPAQQDIHARNAALAEPCVVVLENYVSKTVGPDYRGFRLVAALPTELAANHYVIDVVYRVLTLSSPGGDWPSHAICELRDGVVITLRHP